MESPTPGYTFGMRMEYVRTDLGMTKTAMAKSIKVSPGTLSTYENDSSFPAEKTIGLFCRLYNVNREWLMTDEGEVYLSRDDMDSEENREMEIRKITVKAIMSEGIPKEMAERLYDTNRQKYAYMDLEEFSFFMTLMGNSPVLYKNTD